MSRFADLLRTLLDERGMSQLAFSRRLGHSRNGLISQVLSSNKPPPLDKLDEWADALELVGEERDLMLRCAYDEFAPGYVQRLLQELDGLRDDLGKAGKRTRKRR